MKLSATCIEIIFQNRNLSKHINFIAFIIFASFTVITKFISKKTK